MTNTALAFSKFENPQERKKTGGLLIMGLGMLFKGEAEHKHIWISVFSKELGTIF